MICFHENKCWTLLRNVINLAGFLSQLRNTLRFLLGNLYNFNPEIDRVSNEEMLLVDQYMLHLLQDYGIKVMALEYLSLNNSPTFVRPWFLKQKCTNVECFKQFLMHLTQFAVNDYKSWWWYFKINNYTFLVQKSVLNQSDKTYVWKEVKTAGVRHLLCENHCFNY